MNYRIFTRNCCNSFLVCVGQQLSLINMEINNDYVGHWLREIKDELDETNMRIIHDTLRANHFTTRLKLKLITNEQLDVMFSGSNKLGLGTMAVLKFKLSQLHEESPLVTGKGKRDLRKGKPTKTVRTYFYLYFYT